MTVDDGAFAMGALVELADTMLAQEREGVHDFVEGFAVPGFVFFAELGTAGHGWQFSIFAFCSLARECPPQSARGTQGESTRDSDESYRGLELQTWMMGSV